MKKNLAASVRQRLLNRAQKENKPFNQLLQYFALERFLYRLGRSAYKQQFILKGGLMFALWQAPLRRPTRDIDLLGRLSNSVEHVVSVIQTICQEPVPDDGIIFDTKKISGKQITEGANYQGVQVTLPAYLGKARIPIRIDVGFGDQLVAGPIAMSFPTLLNFPPPELLAYSRESAIAEKFQVMVFLEEINSRLKDFYDIWLLATHFEFNGLTLSEAIDRTFRQRRTVLDLNPVAFDNSFTENSQKQTQWAKFVTRHKFEAAPATLAEAVSLIATFLQPPVQALLKGEHFDQQWVPGGPWSQV
jgi:hypothetical protein